MEPTMLVLRELSLLLEGAHEAPDDDVYLAARLVREDANSVGDAVGQEEAELIHRVANLLDAICRLRGIEPPPEHSRDQRL